MLELPPPNLSQISKARGCKLGELILMCLMCAVRHHKMYLMHAAPKCAGHILVAYKIGGASVNLSEINEMTYQDFQQHI